MRLPCLLITKDTFVDKKQATHYSDLLYQVRLTGDRVHPKLASAYLTTLSLGLAVSRPLSFLASYSV
jgi:hypothetical protein